MRTIRQALSVARKDLSVEFRTKESLNAAGAFVFNRGFARELPNECLDTLLSSPLSAASLLLGKAIANFVMLTVVELISLFVFGIFYGVSWTLRPAALTV